MNGLLKLFVHLLPLKGYNTFSVGRTVGWNFPYDTDFIYFDRLMTLSPQFFIAVCLRRREPRFELLIHWSRAELFEKTLKPGNYGVQGDISPKGVKCSYEIPKGISLWPTASIGT